MKKNGIEFIAERTGVSKATVSCALRGVGRVSPSTRQRVLDVANEIGYRSNQVSRSPRTQRASTVGVVVSDFQSFFARILHGVEFAAQSHEYGVTIACSYGDAAKERQMVDALLQRAVDGIMVAPCNPDENAEYFNGLVEQGARLVFVDSYMPAVDIDVVSTDNSLGGYMAGEHLARLGKKKIALLTYRDQARHSTSVESRMIGCTRALKEAGLEPCALIGPNVPDRMPDEMFAYDAMRDYLASGGELDGLFAGYDDLAYGAIQALRELGLSVPTDVSVVGHDDSEASSYFMPSLTTIRQPSKDIGSYAFDLLHNKIENGANGRPSQRLLLKPTLIVRESCGSAVSSDHGKIDSLYRVREASPVK